VAATILVLGVAGAAQAQGWPKKESKPTPAAERPQPQAAPVPKPTAGAKLEWTTSVLQAMRLSRTQDKVIMAYFCGSDWCDWTKKLDREVIQTPMFVEWAKSNTIPLLVDFPSPDTRQQRSVAKQNELLAATYNVAKVPTLLFLNSDGEVIDRAGYDAACLRSDEKRGEPVQAIAKFDAILASRATGQQVKEFAFLEAASYTEKNGQPIFVLITKPDSKQGMDIRDRLLKSGKFAKFVNTNSAFVDLQWPDEADQSADAKWFRTFVEAHKLGPAPIQMVMLTAGGRKLQHRVLTIAEIDPLINNLAQQLPKFDYTGNWISDYRKAQSIAAQTGRDILLSFTSFDSSEWCQKLQKEIYDTDAFKEYAQKNLVLVQLDFPKTKEQSAALKTQNQGLAESFNIRGYPTIVLLNAKSQTMGTAKYMPGGPEAFIKEMEDLRRRDYERRTLVSETVEVKKKK
jgi:thioredoxin-related protein